MATSGALPMQQPEPDYGRRLIVAWVVACVIAVPLIVFVLGPHLPPGNMSAEARDQRHINTLLAALGAPVLLGIWIFLIFAVRTFRQRGEVIVDGPPLLGEPGLQVAWVATTAAIVLALAAYGTTELLGSTKGAGGGQGPDPLAVPGNASTALQVQVIGQQWAWTFRYPGYGGFETTELGLPVGRLVELHVTSLDVVHSFWAYQLGVKADAIPGSDNVVFVTARHTGTFEARCAELCGLWHGHMSMHGTVVSGAAFPSWIARERAKNAAASRELPPYSTHYFPKPYRRAG
jgi:cytochrome c oxidase subunit II